MKRIWMSLLSFLLGLAAAFFVLANPFDLGAVEAVKERLGLSHDHLATPADEEDQLWTCGMHPQVLQKEPGICPICQMALTPVKKPPSRAEATAPEERKIKYWRAPMDPSYISDQPGKSPMGMDLVPVYEDEVEAQPGVVRIDPRFVQNIGVRSEPVRRADIPLDIRAVGSLTYNDEQIYQITPKYEGWIEKSYVNYVGQPVARGQKLFEIYSPQLINTQKEYLQAIEYAERLSQGNYPEIAERARTLVEASRERLRYWDVTDEQLRELEKGKEVRRRLTIYSEVGGLVVSKMDQALEGIYVKPGMPLLKVVNLSTIWLEAEVYEDQASWLEPGQKARVEIANQPGKSFQGRVRYVFPFYNDKTRTLKLSIELPNPGQRLRAGMYANVLFEVPAVRDALAVPQDAVIHGGLRDVAVVDLGDGTFQVRTVTLGATGGGLYEVRSGLREGERVVVSSQFLIDSESNLQEAVRQLTGGAGLDAQQESRANER